MAICIAGQPQCPIEQMAKLDWLLTVKDPLALGQPASDSSLATVMPTNPPANSASADMLLHVWLCQSGIAPILAAADMVSRLSHCALYFIRAYALHFGPLRAMPCLQHCQATANFDCVNAIRCHVHMYRKFEGLRCLCMTCL